MLLLRQDVKIAMPLAACCLAACGSPAASTSAPSCAVVAACGGDLSGTWEFDSGCLTLKPPFQQPECQTTERSAEYTPRGTVTYSISATQPLTGTIEPSFSWRFTADEVYSPACLSALGFTPGTKEACDGLAVFWSGPFVVSCFQAQGGCECTFADEQNADQPADFSIADGQIVLSPGDVRDYCRTGTSLVESTVSDSSISRVSLHLRDP
jgi:hypothetical protein